MSTTLVLFTRDLRVHDNPALHEACTTADAVIPLFVVDPQIRSSPNRQRFLIESLADLRDSLRSRGGDLAVRHGDPVVEAVNLAKSVDAQRVLVAADVSSYAARRQERLTDACETARLGLKTCDGITIVPAGAVRPTGGGDHFRVFTPYFRAWSSFSVRDPVPPPGRVELPPGIDTGALPVSPTGGSSRQLSGGESAGRKRLTSWRRRAEHYADRHDDIAADATSRLSAYIHFGCLSPLAVAAAVDSQAFRRQLCWRDFYHQVLASFPGLPRQAYRRGAVERWRDDPDALAAWQSGHTGVPIVDAGMRQLATEGFMHNRARLITASFLTKRLGLDWRVGAQWYAEWLVDADVANNYGNWQWVAGTGNDPRFNRQFNPIRQARRFDPDGSYVRRWVPELADIPGPAVHEPWRLHGGERDRIGYPSPIMLSAEAP